MSLYPDEPDPFTRSPEHMKRLLELLRKYWLRYPEKRLELVLSMVSDDYHFNTDAQIEEELCRRLEKRP